MILVFKATVSSFDNNYFLHNSFLRPPHPFPPCLLVCVNVFCSVALMRIMPWAVSFHERLKLLRDTMSAERTAIQGPDDPSGLSSAPRSRGTVVRVRRARMLEDGMAAIEKVALISAEFTV